MVKELPLYPVKHPTKYNSLGIAKGSTAKVSLKFSLVFHFSNSFFTDYTKSIKEI